MKSLYKDMSESELEKAFLMQVDEAVAELVTKNTLTQFMLGGHTALQLAYDSYADDIKNAETFDELKEAAERLLTYLQNKSQGLKNNAG